MLPVEVLHERLSGLVVGASRVENQADYQVLVLLLVKMDEVNLSVKVCSVNCVLTGLMPMILSNCPSAL